MTAQTLAHRTLPDPVDATHAATTPTGFRAWTIRTWRRFCAFNAAQVEMHERYLQAQRPWESR